MKNRRTEHSVVNVNDEIYILGGYDKKNNKFLKECEIFNYSTNKFQTISPMLTAKCGFSATFHENEIYVIGGFEGSKRLTTIEKYNLKTKEWNFMNL